MCILFFRWLTGCCRIIEQLYRGAHSKQASLQRMCLLTVLNVQSRSCDIWYELQNDFDEAVNVWTCSIQNQYCEFFNDKALQLFLSLEKHI